MFHAVDVLATLLGLAGVRAPPQGDGVDQWPALSSPSAPPPPPRTTMVRGMMLLTADWRY